MGSRKKNRGRDHTVRGAPPAGAPADDSLPTNDSGANSPDPPRRNLPLLCISSALMASWILVLIWLVLSG